MERPDYGNWIRLRIVVIFLTIGVILAAGGFLPVSLPARIALWALAAFPLGMGLYLTYVYIQFAGWGGGYQDKLWNLVLAQLDWDGRGTALDIGTGNAALAIRVARRFAEARVTGIDLWGSAWEYGHSTCENNARIEGVADRAEFRRASAASLPFKDASFDAAVSHFVFHEVGDASNKREVIKESLRVLKPGGAFAFQDMFLNEAMYGPRDDLLAAIRSWGVAQVEFVDSTQVLSIPGPLRSRRALGYASILHGRK